MTDLVTIAESQSPVETVLAAARARGDELLAVLPALDAMNSFVRSEVHRRHWGWRGIAKGVYHYKRTALREMSRMQLASHRLVSVRTKCRDCGGSGRYYDSNGYTHDHCWLCRSSGYVTLRFVESTVLGGIVWHTPERDAFGIGMRTADVDATPVDNWTVHQVGKDLTPSEVATHMMAIERVITERPRAYYHEESWHDTYCLWIGETSRVVCLICGSTKGEPHCGHCVTTGRFQWTACACRTCRDQAEDGEIFDVLARLMPAEFLTPPINEWAALHPAPRPKPKPQPMFPVAKIVKRSATVGAWDAEIPF